MPRESEPKRHRSRFHREPSPKRSRRNGKPTMERSPNRLSTEVREKDDDRKHHRRLQDPLPLEKPPASDSKHDDRNAGQDGASTGHRGTAERGWWRDHKDDQRGKHQTSSDVLEKDAGSVAHGDDNRVQKHDQSSKTNADHSKPTRKKFREEKLPPAESQPEEKAEAEPVKPALLDGIAAGGGRREERGIHRHSDRTERDRASYYTGGSLPNRARPEKAGGFPSRDRYGSGVHGGRFRGREGYSGRQGYHPGGGRVEKWKHDLFDEVNRSPPKNEEDPVAKVEALLAL